LQKKLHSLFELREVPAPNEFTKLESRVIEDLARLVTTGLILGFVVKGEIALVGEVGVINNL
jgi:hypothetical protein